MALILPSYCFVKSAHIHLTEVTIYLGISKPYMSKSVKKLWHHINVTNVITSFPTNPH